MAQCVIIDGLVIPGADISQVGFAISSGSHIDGSPHGNAFDNSTGTRWASSQSGGGVANVAYIGQDFGAGNEKDIIQVGMFPIASISTGYLPSSVAVQYSDNGSSWTTAYSWSGYSDANALQVSPQFPSAGAHRYWRLLATAHAGASYWSIWEAEFRPAVFA